MIIWNKITQEIISFLIVLDFVILTILKISENQVIFKH